MRLFYSKFFGLEIFNASFNHITTLLNLMFCVSLGNILFCLLPLIIVDIYGLIVLSWGTQLYIVLIETLVLSLIIIIITLLEMCFIRKLRRGETKDSVHSELIKSDADQTDEDLLEQKMREDAL